MRLRISLFELLLLVIPACAIVLGLLVAAVNASGLYILTIAQSVYLAAMLAAVCALFQRRSGVRIFGGAFLAASLGHLLLVWLASQSSYAAAFPTTFALTRIWEQAHPGQAVNLDSGIVGGGSTWSSFPPTIYGGSGFSGGFNPYAGGMPAGSTIPLYQFPIGIQRPLFVEVGIWAISLLLGVLCGVVARSLRGPEPEPSKTAAA